VRAGRTFSGRSTSLGAALLALVVCTSASRSLAAQGRGGPPQGPPPTPQAAARIDLTGNWVSIVNEDWRWRMVTPPKGDYASLPLTQDARTEADKWDAATDGSCRAYGAAALMRMPTRVQVAWESPSVLKLDTDAGQQTRRFIFDSSVATPTARSLQGFSRAEWEGPPAGRGGPGGPPPGGPGGPAARGGSLKVVTTMLSGGWLRKNGVPYSENAEVTEYYDRFRAPNGDEWLVVTTTVRDPKYLNQDFTTSSHFKKEADASKFAASPCKMP